MMLALGMFVIGYAIWSLASPSFKGKLNQLWAVPFGAIGGVFSAMFGSGGFIYAIYLSRRLDDKDAMRATVERADRARRLHADGDFCACRRLHHA